MQVANSKEQSSSATLGAKSTKGFSLVQDASFFMMLSSNLYSNPLLAAIREPLCNAWDAHIEAGKTDVPLIITFTAEGDLTIADSGFGIHDDNMEDVYGTYGKSTKKNDDKTTGGFGLGCKAPFAVAESFRVVSEHDGVKSIYNMTRSSINNEGMPGLDLITSMPTDRSGLSVTFRVPEGDFREVEEYIRNVVLHGEMKATFHHYMHDNAQTLSVLGMSQDKGSWSLDSREWYNSYMGNHKVFIRYGTVVYPALRTKGTDTALDLIEKFMAMVGYARILVQAAPSTLALTPSRETLSNQKMTEDGIVDLCVNLVDAIEKEIQVKIPAEVNRIGNLLKMGHINIGLPNVQFPYNHIRDTAVQSYILSGLGKTYRKKYYEFFVHANHYGFCRTNAVNNRSLASDLLALRKRLLKAHGDNNYPLVKSLFAKFVRKHMTDRLLGLVSKSPELEMKRLRLSRPAQCYGESWNSHFLEELSANWLKPVLTLMDNPIVFITSRLRGVEEVIYQHPRYKNNRNRDFCWTYKIEPSCKNKAEIIAEFRGLKYTVVDLTVPNSWDVLNADRIREAQELAAARKAGTLPPVAKIVSVNGMNNLRNLKRGSKGWDGSLFKGSDRLEHQTDKPLFYIENPVNWYTGILGAFGHIELLTDEEWDNGVIVRNGIEKNMAVKRGAIPAKDYFRQRFFDFVTKGQYKKYASKLRKKALSTRHHVSSWDLRFCRENGIKLPGYAKLTHDPKMEACYEILQNMGNNWYASEGYTAEQHDALIELKKLKLEELPFVKNLKILADDWMIRQLGGTEQISKLMLKYPERKAALRSLILSALKSGKPICNLRP